VNDAPGARRIAHKRYVDVIIRRDEALTGAAAVLADSDETFEQVATRDTNADSVKTHRAQATHRPTTGIVKPARLVRLVSQAGSSAAANGGGLWKSKAGTEVAAP
jgi:hypothetical protein